MPLNPTRLRTMVDGWLNDTCTINAKGAAPVFDIDDGYDTDEGDVVYSGKCRLRPTGGERVVIVGDAPLTLRMFDLTLPYDAVGFEVDQLVEMTDSNDAYLIGRTYRVVDVQGGSDTAYRRLIVEDTVDVGQWETGS